MKTSVMKSRWLKQLEDLSSEDSTVFNTFLSGKSFPFGKFRKARLGGVNIEGAHFTFADFSHAQLNGANLKQACLFGANLVEADLRNADLTGADLNRASFALDFTFSKFKCGISLIYQLLAHIATLTVTDEPEEFEKIKEFILPYAKQSHCAIDLELVEDDRIHECDEEHYDIPEPHFQIPSPKGWYLQNALHEMKLMIQDGNVVCLFELEDVFSDRRTRFLFPYTNEDIELLDGKIKWGDEKQFSITRFWCLNGDYINAVIDLEKIYAMSEEVMVDA